MWERVKQLGLNQCPSVPKSFTLQTELWGQRSKAKTQLENKKNPEVDLHFTKQQTFRLVQIESICR